MAYLILVRHGESLWNAKGLWTGWEDIGLSEKGREEAKKAGEAIKDIKIDKAYTSVLSRAKETLEEIIKVFKVNGLPVTEDQALNERDYGDFTGKDKWQIKEKYGEKQFLKWRRSWDEPIPGGETLKDVYKRTVPYYKKTILEDLKEGKNILVSAHGNSLRALVKFLENISDEEIPNLEIATGEIYLYKVDHNGNIVSKEIRASHPNMA